MARRGCSGSEHGKLAEVKVRAIVALIGDVPLADVGTGHADEVVLKLRAAGKAPGTLAARYVVNEKTAAGRALDPVAHFHLSNGARCERLNWRGDLSARGMQQAYGMMINYLYRLSDIEENHEAYTAEGRVTASSALLRLAKG
jgi:hypothetical protein